MITRWLRRLERRSLEKAGLDSRPMRPDDWKGLGSEEAFSHIYRKGLWGSGPGFQSGEGSRDPDVVLPYVAAVLRWADDRGALDVVDLGCGDFVVGRQIRPAFRAYVACDVVPALIAHHLAGPDAGTVDFRCLDLSRDPLPPGDVVFIRQVLQHLPNAMISKLVPKLYAFRWLVLTEHLPIDPNFPPNRDKPIGPGIRKELGSGVDLCARPFNLKVKGAQVLCEVPQFGGIIRTTAYQLQG